MFVAAIAIGLAPIGAWAAQGEVEIRVVDKDTGKPIAVRMHLKDQRGRPVKPPKLPVWNDHFVFGGKVVLKLRPGTYQFEMERGPEYVQRTGYFTIKSGATDNKQVDLQRFVDMKSAGWYSGELHVHRDVKDVELLMLAEDLHVAPVITWWNNRNLWSDRQPPDDLLVQFDGDRYYHVMAGEDERQGGALLYFNLREPLDLAGSSREYPSPMKFLEQARAQEGVHIDIEKPFWWDVPVWIASGKVDSIGLANNHQMRDGMLADEAWGKPRDMAFYPNPHGNGRWSQDMYYKLLNCGVRIPPSAGSASGVLKNPVGYNRVYVHCGDDFSYENWFKNLRAGKVVVTNGPLLQPLVNGELPGHVFTAAAGESVELSPSLTLSLREKVDYLEVIQNGKVVHEVRLDEYAKSGGKLPKVTFDKSGWMLIRAVTNNPNTWRFGSTGPYYVEIGNEPHISKSAAQFFLDWVNERVGLIQLDDEAQRAEVLEPHAFARDFWQAKVDAANAE